MTFLPDTGKAFRRDVANFNLGASAVYCVSAHFNLMLEWMGTWNETVDERGRVPREFGSVISPGARYAINFPNGSQCVLGLGLPLGLTKNVPEISAFLYLSFEHRVFGKEQK